MHLPDSLRSLRRPNLQLFFAGQTVSLVGTWMQSVAQQWLVWRLTRNAGALGTVAFLGQFPVALLGVVGGSVADRLPRRAIVFTTQSLAALQAGALAAVTLTGAVHPIHVYLLAATLGVITAFDIPARQALLADMAEDDLGNAIALNSSVVNGARMVGPAIAGFLVATVGEGVCFLLNALSYLAILVSLARMRVPPVARSAAVPGHLDHFLDGMRYAFGTPHVRALLLLLGASSIFGLSYLALVPVFADHVLGGGAKLLGALLGAGGVGALAGAVSLLARRGLAGLGGRVAWGSTLFALGLAAFSLSRWTWLSLPAMAAVGFGYMLQLASTNTLLQSLAPPEMRGRVIGLFSTVFIGALAARGAGRGLAGHPHRGAAGDGPGRHRGARRQPRLPRRAAGPATGDATRVPVELRDRAARHVAVSTLS